MKRIFELSAIAFLLLAVTPYVFAANDLKGPNLLIVSPPMDSFEFYGCSQYTGIRAQYLTTSGDGVSLSGVSASFAMDFGLNSKYAGLYMGIFQIGVMNGHFNPYITDIWILSYTIPISLKVQLVRVKYFNLGFIAGVNGGIASMQGDALVGGSEVLTLEGGGWIGGYNTGIQGGIKLAGFAFTPFFMIQKEKCLNGNDLTVTSDTNKNINYTIHAPDLLHKYYGFKITYDPWDISFNGMMETIPKSDSVNGYTNYSFGFTFLVDSKGKGIDYQVPVEKLNPDDYIKL